MLLFALTAEVSAAVNPESEKANASSQERSHGSRTYVGNTRNEGTIWATFYFSMQYENGGLNGKALLMRHGIRIQNMGACRPVWIFYFARRSRTVKSGPSRNGANGPVAVSPWAASVLSAYGTKNKCVR